MNAIAGLAAKREAAAVQKGATGGSQTPPPPSAESPPASPGQSNRFSVLQSLRQKQEPAKAPKTRPAPAPNRLAPGTPIHLATEAPKLTQYSSFRLSKGNSHLRRDGIVELRLKDGEVRTSWSIHCSDTDTPALSRPRELWHSCLDRRGDHCRGNSSSFRYCTLGICPLMLRPASLEDGQRNGPRAAQ